MPRNSLLGCGDNAVFALLRYSTDPGELFHLGDALMDNVWRTLPFEAGAVIRGCSQIRTRQVHVSASGNDPFLLPFAFPGPSCIHLQCHSFRCHFSLPPS